MIMFIYCFDKEEKFKLESKLKLFKETNIDNKQCWIFVFDKDKDNKFIFNEINKSKCIVSNRMRF